MATVQLPNGDTMEVPDNFTADQVKAAAAKVSGGGQQAAPQPAQSSGPTDRQKTLSNAGSRFLRGMTDPIDAGAQLLTHALPEGLVNAVNSGAQFVNDLPGIGPLTKALGMTPATSGGLDKRIREGEQEYQAARKQPRPRRCPALLAANAIRALTSPAHSATSRQGSPCPGAMRPAWVRESCKGRGPALRLVRYSR